MKKKEKEETSWYRSDGTVDNVRGEGTKEREARGRNSFPGTKTKRQEKSKKIYFLETWET